MADVEIEKSKLWRLDKVGKKINWSGNGYQNRISYGECAQLVLQGSELTGVEKFKTTNTKK